MNKVPTILVIFGISGDLAKRYLLPALKAIDHAKMLPEKFKIVGITRQPGSDFFQMDLTKSEEYERLNDYIKQIEAGFSKPSQRLFYLSIPPEACKSVIEFIGKSSLIKNSLQKKVLLEKPFGTNLENATDLAKHVGQYFTPTEIYRVDHYMAKETAQNIIIFREGNSLFKKTWNKDFIESIEIIASEEIGVAGRASFYEQTGALRDIVQSHLLQLAALTLMELPENMEEVPILREKALSQLNIVCNIKENKCVKRAQYKGYREEVGNKHSRTETFVSINLQSNDPKWQGVPITLSTGKSLHRRFTEIKIHYRKEKQRESNELILRLQPDAGIEFSIWTKVPGYEHKLNSHHLSFKFKDHYNILPDAYEQVLFNAINSDHRLFTSSGEVIETWRILDEVQKTWEKSDEDLLIYKKGSTVEEVLHLE